MLQNNYLHSEAPSSLRDTTAPPVEAWSPTPPGKVALP